MIPDWLKPPFDYKDIATDNDHIAFLFVQECLESIWMKGRTKQWIQIILKDGGQEE